MNVGAYSHMHLDTFFQLFDKYSIQGCLCPFDNKSTLVYIMVLHQTGDKPLYKSMMIQLTGTLMHQQHQRVYTSHPVPLCCSDNIKPHVECIRSRQYLRDSLTWRSYSATRRQDTPLIIVSLGFDLPCDDLGERQECHISFKHVSGLDAHNPILYIVLALW